MSNVKIVAIIQAKADQIDAMRAVLSELRTQSRQEPGNLLWNVWEDRATPGRFVLDELYRDDAAVEAHRETPHFKKYLTHFPALGERQPYVLHPVMVD